MIEEIIESIPKYIQLANIIKAHVLKEKYLLEHKIPSERELAGRYRVNFSTVNKAISTLVAGGYLYRVHGKGTFVSGKKITPVKYPIAFIHEIAKEGEELRQHPLYGGLLQYLSQEINKRGDAFQIYHSMGKSLFDNDNQPLKNVLMRKEIQGYFLFVGDPSLFWREIKHIGLPFVCLGCRRGPQGVPNRVIIDSLEAGYMGTKYLLGLGYKHIGVLHPFTTKHKKWFLEGCRKAFLEETEKIDGLLTSTELDELFPESEVLYISDDYLANKVICQILARGIKVPGELGLLVFANKGINFDFPIGISKVEIDPIEIGKIALDLLVKQIEGNPGTKEPIFIAPGLVKKDSCQEKKQER